MNCREAQSQIFATGGDAPGETPRTALEAHVAHCAACRQIQENLAAALATWRTDSARATVPDVEREWHAVRRQIRGGSETGSAPARPRRSFFSWLALPIVATAAAAFALMVFVQQRPSATPSAIANGNLVTARADFVEAPGNDASTMVIVDDKSGWVIVWASDSAPKSG